MIKARRTKLFSMFCLGVLFQFGKKLYLVTILLCAVLILVACKRYSVNEVSNQLDSSTYTSNGGSFETNYPDVLDSHISSEVSRYSLQKNSLENVCPTSNAFCFPSTLTEPFDGDIGTDLDDIHDSIFQPEKLSARLKQESNNPSWPGDHRIFQLSDGRTVSCTFQMRDGFELLSNDIDIRNGQQTCVSACVRPVVDHESYVVKSGENVRTIDSEFLNGLSTPPVEIKPSLLDWGQQNMYDPSLACLTVKNMDTGILSVYDPYSSNSQFYPCNFSETILRPLETLSICFVFLPSRLGLSSAQLVLQTSLGGFLVQAKSIVVASPYLVKPLNSFDDSSNGMWRKNISLFNPFNETFSVEQVTVWIYLSSGRTSILSEAICSIHAEEDTSEHSNLIANDWLDVESVGVGPTHISMRPHMHWHVDPQSTRTIVEFNFKYHVEGKIVCAFCLLLKSSTDMIDTIMVPFEAEISPNPVPAESISSASLETFILCNVSGSTIFAVSVRNDAPYLSSVIDVREVGDGAKFFLIRFIEGLLLFPGSVTQLAILNYTHSGIPEDMVCKILVLINDTRNPRIEIPCIEVIHAASHKPGHSVGNAQGINNVGYMNGGQEVSSTKRFLPYSEGIDTCEADGSVLRNWESHATMQYLSVLEDRKLLFPMVHVGDHCSQWIAVKNPSHEPVMMQLILNSGAIIDKCRTAESLLLPSLSILSSKKSTGPTSYGFSLPKDAITEVFVRPYGRALLGPILFHPSHRCQWRSSALIRNNISGVEWISLRGFGGSYSLVFHVGSVLVQSLEFEPKLPTRLNFSSTNMFSSEEDSCSQPLKKDLYVKNVGDLSVDVVRIDVSGSECGLDGFLINNCEGFSLQPGESSRLQISYHTDFSSCIIHRDLELALATGILVIPMKASLPPYVLDFCKRSMFWMGVRKGMVGVLAVSLFFMACFFYRAMILAYQEIRSGIKSSTVNCLERLAEEKEALALKSAGISSELYTSFIEHENPSAKYHEKNIMLDDQQEFVITSSAMSKSSSLSSFVVHNETDSRNLRIIIGKEKGRRRKKKRNSVTGTFELSSSHSGSSTPSSPLSPILCTASKRLIPLPPEMDHCIGNGNTFDQVPDQKHENPKLTEAHSRINLVGNEASSKSSVNKWELSAQEKPCFARKTDRRAVLFPSATFPSSGRAASPWTCDSHYLASSSTIAPHARAPGSKINTHKAGEPDDKTSYEDKMYLETKAGVENLIMYDIWGDHLFGLPFSFQSTQVSSKPTHAHENNSESFFVGDPPTLFTNS